MSPQFDLDKFKFATDRPTFEKAVRIYESGGVIDFEDAGFGFSAKVRGSQGNLYQVYVTAKHYDQGNCDCYLGEQEILCKHMVAVAIYALKQGKKLVNEDKKFVGSPECGSRLGELTKAELLEIKAEITVAMRHIKPYNGPSRIWFAYQNSLSEGCNRLAKIVSELPVGEQTTKLLVGLLLWLDKKLSEGGVDDSDGTVGGFIEECVEVLKKYAELDAKCALALGELRGKETCFGWEESLIEIFDKSRN